MNKAEFVGVVAEKAGFTKKDTDRVVGAMLDTIVEALQNGDRVQLVGFGAFEVRHREARVGRNPQTKQPMNLPASKTPAFKAGKAFKDIIDKS